MKRNPFDGDLSEIDLWSGASAANGYGALTTNSATTADWSLAKMIEAMDKAKQIRATRQTADILTGIDRGVPVHADKYLTKTRKPPTRRRRRLWRHWKATRTIPDPNVYLIAGQMLVGHPDTIARMVEALNRMEKESP